MGNPTSDHDGTPTGAEPASVGRRSVMLDEVHVTVHADHGTVDADGWREVEHVVAAELDVACRRAMGRLTQRFPDAHIDVKRSR